MRPGEKLFRELDHFDITFIEEGSTPMIKKKKKWLGIVAAMLTVLIAMPNVSPAFATKLTNIPLIGQVFEVVTFRNIDEKKGSSELDVTLPKIDNLTENDSVDAVNAMIEAYSDKLINHYYEDINENRGLLQIDYEVVTNSEDWFTIVINAFEVQASGYQRKRYYNIDKTSGDYRTFSTLFSDFEHSKALINENIVSQMAYKTENEGHIYFDDAFNSVQDQQNYYFNDKNELIVSFDEYEIAPGFMGVVEFVLPGELIE